MTAINFKLKFKLTAGEVIFPVAGPFRLCIAFAADTPVLAYVTPSIVSGFEVEFFSGSQRNINDSETELCCIMRAAIKKLESFKNFFAALFIGGPLPLLSEIVKVCSIFNHNSSNVLKGLSTATVIYRTFLKISKIKQLAIGNKMGM
ncbi:MAG TPA: hypothetical protein VMR70_03520 [Flavisolibacter sp.]|nr:hypothetical protein [Flavisolibacter sp.]